MKWFSRKPEVVEVKYCEDCQYHIPWPHDETTTNLDKCGAPQMGGAALVRRNFSGGYCDIERRKYGNCEPSALLFKPKATS